MGPSNRKHIYTKDEIEYLLKNNHLYIDDLVASFNATFGLSQSRNSIYKALARNGAPRDKQNYLSKEEISFIERNFTKIKLEEFTDLFNRTFHRKMSSKRLRVIANQKLGLKKDTVCTRDLLPIGATSIRGGRAFIKIANPNGWVPKNRYIYEMETGEDISGLCVVALDRNPLNCEINNLIAIDLRTLGKAIGHNLLSKEKSISIVGVELAKLLVVLEDMDCHECNFDVNEALEIIEQN